MFDDDLDDLLGSPEAVEYDLPELDDEDLLDSHVKGGKSAAKTLTQKGAATALKGASVGWFASVLRLGRTTVQRKLDSIAPVGITSSGAKLYDVREAMPYLVQPHDLRRHLSAMNPRDLPERLRKEFWGARKLEQQVRKEAGDLWSSADVHRAFGDVLRLIKDTAILWTDEIDETAGLTSEQVEILDNLVRALLASIGEKVEQYAKDGMTLSHESEYDDEDEDQL